MPKRDQGDDAQPDDRGALGNQREDPGHRPAEGPRDHGPERDLAARPKVVGRDDHRNRADHADRQLDQEQEERETDGARLVRHGQAEGADEGDRESEGEEEQRAADELVDRPTEDGTDADLDRRQHLLDGRLSGFGGLPGDTGLPADPHRLRGTVRSRRVAVAFVGRWWRDIVTRHISALGHSVVSRCLNAGSSAQCGTGRGGNRCSRAPPGNGVAAAHRTARRRTTTRRPRARP